MKTALLLVGALAVLGAGMAVEDPAFSMTVTASGLN